MTLGFYTTLVLEGAERSLAAGKKLSGGTMLGIVVELEKLLVDELGAEAAREYKLTT